jgi:hypothetical protein
MLVCSFIQKQRLRKKRSLSYRVIEGALVHEIPMRFKNRIRLSIVSAIS